MKMIHIQTLVGDLGKGHLGSDDAIRSHQQVFANNSRLKRATGIVLVLSRRIDWYATWPTWVHMWLHVTLTCGQILAWPFLDESKTMVLDLVR